MRESCTYGSMRGRAFPTGRPAQLYTLGVLCPYIERMQESVRAAYRSYAAAYGYEL